MQVLGDALDAYEEPHGALVGVGGRQRRPPPAHLVHRRETCAILTGLGREASDEEIAEEDQEADVRIALPVDTWTRLRAAGRATDLLDVTEHGGLDDARIWLRQQGHAWVEARPSPTGPPPGAL